MPSSYSVELAARVPGEERREVFFRMNPVFDPTESPLDSPMKRAMDDILNGTPESRPSSPETKSQLSASGPQRNGAHNPPGNTATSIGSTEGRMHLSPEEPRSRPSRWRQHLAALFAALSAVSVGYVDAWTANALPFLQATPPVDSVLGINISQVTQTPNGSQWTSLLDNVTRDYSIMQSLPATSTSSPVQEGPFFSLEELTTDVIHGINSEQSSWLSSLVPIGAMIGSFPAGILADKMGRKVVLLYMTLPCLISWVIIIFGSHSLVWLFLTRTIQGVIMGIVLVVVPLYNEEISEVEVRGAIGVYQNMMVTVGILCGYIVGAFVPYQWTAIVPCAIPICMLFSFTWMPESPVFLASKDRIAEAIKGLQWLRGEKFCDASAVLGRSSPQSGKEQAVPSSCMELAEMGSQSSTATAQQQTPQTESSGSWMKVPPLLRNACVALTERQTAFPLMVVFALMSFRQLSGIHAVVFYTVEIFSGARSSLPHAYEAIVIGAVEVAATCAASRLVDRVGRRPLLLTSGAGTAACHAGLALYFYCLGAGVPLSRYSWLPLLLLSLFIVLHACGFGPLPWFMMAELTPTEHKNWATGVTGFLNWGSMFLVLKLFPTMTGNLGDCFTFAVFAFNCAASTCFVYFLVPETKGKTLEEIQEEVGKRR